MATTTKTALATPVARELRLLNGIPRKTARPARVTAVLGDTSLQAWAARMVADAPPISEGAFDAIAGIIRTAGETQTREARPAA